MISILASPSARGRESYLAHGDALVSEIVIGVDRAHQLDLVLLVT